MITIDRKNAGYELIFKATGAKTFKVYARDTDAIQECVEHYYNYHRPSDRCPLCALEKKENFEEKDRCPE